MLNNIFVFFVILSLIFSAAACKKEITLTAPTNTTNNSSPCITKIDTLQQGITYTADRNGTVVAYIHDCYDVWIIVDGIYMAGDRYNSVAVNTHVNKGQKFKITSQCMDNWIDVYFFTFCP